MKAIAIKKGLIPADAQLTDSEIDNLLFLPGFSTAETVSNISGRGVGMDVVKRSIQALGGRISITSRPGQGSTFSMSLPLTLAVLDGMVVKVADQTLVVPLNVDPGDDEAEGRRRLWPRAREPGHRHSRRLHAADRRRLRARLPLASRRSDVGRHAC